MLKENSFNIIKRILDGISAGIMIAIGCSVYLACDNKYVGAVLFSVALLTICFKGFNLFTGKVGYIVNSHKKEDFSTLLLGLFGNAVATCLLGFVLGLAIPNLSETAVTLFNAKMQQQWWQTFIRAIFCGVLMYVAVSVYRENKSVLGIIFAIPVFILSGFEHSIADMCYFGFSGIVSLDAFVFIIIVILGNTIGGMLLPLLKITYKKVNEKSIIENAVNSEANNSENLKNDEK